MHAFSQVRLRTEFFYHAGLTWSQKTFTPKQWEAEQQKKQAEEAKMDLQDTVAESDPPVSTA
jgi:hypothetical protein